MINQVLDGVQSKSGQKTMEIQIFGMLPGSCCDGLGSPFTDGARARNALQIDGNINLAEINDLGYFCVLL